MSVESIPVLLCTAGERPYALPVADILEVAALVEITPLPAAPPEVVGVVNRRGAALPLLDLRRCLGHPPRALDLSTLFVVVRAGGPGGSGRMAGLITDDVRGVIHLPAEATRLPATGGPFVRGIAVIDSAPVLMLDVTALLQAFAPPDLIGEGIS